MLNRQLSKKGIKQYVSTLLVIILFSISNTEAQVSGLVFKDYNNDGIQTLPNEIGMRNITVSVFVSSSKIPFVTQTGIDGHYAFTETQVPVGNKVRVEFSNIGFNNDGRKSSESKTSVQFLTIPAGGANKVSLGVLSKSDYCSLDESIIFTPCYVSGNPLTGGSAGEEDALVYFPSNATGVGGTTGPMPTHVAKASEVGSLWGVDYQNRGKSLLTSAVVRRHVGLGPLGTGGIYKFNTDNQLVEPFIDVKTLGINTGIDPHTDLPNDKLETSEDAAIMDVAGKVGIGSIALTSDEKTLYMVNLFDRKLYSFYVGIPAQKPSITSVKSYTIPNPCNNNDYRPWGLKEYQGKLYLGVVCTSETAQDSTALTGTIYEFDPKLGNFNTFFQFPLTYKRGYSDVTDECINIRYWRPWSNKFPKACANAFNIQKGKQVGFAINPQPLITDLEFDSDGSLIIGLMDRFGLLAGSEALAPVDDGKLYSGFISGDILRVNNNNGVYEMENNGKAGSLTGSGVGNDEGFGGGEFYGRDYWKFFGKPAHNEITNGGLLLLPGKGEIIASAMDPVDEVYNSAGFQVFSNTDGSLKRSFAVYANKAGTLGKSGGIGDLKATCGNAFIEIGNRIWNDLNKDGIQDANENGIDGLTVTLHDMDNSEIEVGRTITTEGGTYYFNNANVTSTIQYEHNYQVRVKMTQSILTSNNLSEVSPKSSLLTPDTPENPEQMRDSNAQLIKLITGNCAIINFKTGALTISNHSLDIGLINPICQFICVPMTVKVKR